MSGTSSVGIGESGTDFRAAASRMREGRNMVRKMTAFGVVVSLL